MQETIYCCSRPVSRRRQTQIKMKTLIKSLKKVISVVPKKASSAILGTILLNSDGENLEIAAVGNELSIKISLPYNNKLSCCLNGKLLFDFLRTANDVKLEQRERSLLVESNNSKIELPIYPSEEFPQFFEIEGDKISVYARDIKNAFRMVDFIPEREWYQDYKTSILLDYIHRFLRIVASDDHRLGVFGTMVEVEEKIDDRKVLISKDTALILEKILPDDGEINIYFAKNGLFFEDKDGGTMFAQSINGQFPDYEKVLPRDETTYCSFEVQREELIQSLSRVSLIADIATIKVEDKLEILGESEKGKIKEVVEIFDNKGNIESNYNVQYLLQPLSRIDNETVQVKFGSYKIISLNSKQYIYVLSPVEGEGKNA
jgi:DNA polymerase-3 subunit beta